MKLVVTETINNMVEVEKLETILEIADFDVGFAMLKHAVHHHNRIGNISLTDNRKVSSLDRAVQVEMLHCRPRVWTIMDS